MFCFALLLFVRFVESGAKMFSSLLRLIKIRWELHFLFFLTSSQQQVSDLVIILNHERAVEAFAKGGNLTLGGNFTVAIGPLGRWVSWKHQNIRAVPVFTVNRKLHCWSSCKSWIEAKYVTLVPLGLLPVDNDFPLLGFVCLKITVCIKHVGRNGFGPFLLKIEHLGRISSIGFMNDVFDNSWFYKWLFHCWVFCFCF